MVKQDLFDKSTIRLFDAATEGGLKAGELGLVTSKKGLGKYLFFVDFNGHIDDDIIKNIIDEIEDNTYFFDSHHSAESVEAYKSAEVWRDFADRIVAMGEMYTAVDLGLPSGTKWASFNVGASSHLSSLLNFIFVCDLYEG